MSSPVSTKYLKDTVDPCGCLTQKKKNKQTKRKKLTRYLTHNHHELYINGS